MLLVGNGKVITRNLENPYLEDGAVAIEGEVISEVGKLEELKKKYPQAEFLVRFPVHCLRSRMW